MFRLSVIKRQLMFTIEIKETVIRVDSASRDGEYLSIQKTAAPALLHSRRLCVSLWSWLKTCFWSRINLSCVDRGVIPVAAPVVDEGLATPTVQVSHK